MAKEIRNRKRMGFWINYDKDDDLLVAETIDVLKSRRKYQRAILQGIQLMYSLWEGRVDVLLTMFPWVAEVIVQPAPAPPDTGHLERQIADLKRLIMEQGAISAPPKDYPQMKSNNTLGIGKKMALPMFDDDDDGSTLILSKSTSASINGDNLLAGMMGL